jgi:hypothetical protein
LEHCERGAYPVNHHGKLPMPITYRLHYPMPTELFEKMKVATV